MKLRKFWKRLTTALLTAATVVTMCPVFGGNANVVEAATLKEEPDYVIIALDPGHSGSDGGASNAALGTVGEYNEQRCNWKIMSACKSYLEKYENVKIVVTRKEYEGVSLSDRVDRIAAAGANLSVSFHCNSAGSISSAQGCEVYYSVVEPYKANTFQLSKDICSNLSSDLGLYNRGPKTRESTKYPGFDYLTLIEGPVKNGIPGILIEHAFVSNYKDAKLLTNDAALVKMGIADAKAIAKYFALKPKAGSGAIDMSGYTSMKMDTRGTAPNAPETSKIAYAVHRQTYGWEQYEAYDGKTSGTTGEGKRLEAIKIRNNTDIEGSVEYQVHCQSYGWMDWEQDGSMAGTKGQAKRLEAIRIQLTGKLSEVYDVYYRVHAQSYGWLGWAKNGKTAGTAGYAKRLEAIQIVLVEKGGNPPSDDVDGVPSTVDMKPYQSPKVCYRTHVQSFGWQGNKYDGEVSGTTGLAKRLESISITDFTDLDGDIEYRVHVQSYGWQDWKKNGAYAGTVGQAKRLEAIQIKLTGEIAEKYDVYYRVHAQSFGWLGWAKNGEPSGTAGYAKRLEGIQIVYVPKGEKAPGSTARAFVGVPPQ